MPDRPAGNPRDLLRIWMEWEKGDAMPGKMMSDLKRLGLRELLEGLAEQAGPEAPAPETAPAGSDG